MKHVNFIVDVIDIEINNIDDAYSFFVLGDEKGLIADIDARYPIEKGDVITFLVRDSFDPEGYEIWSNVDGVGVVSLDYVSLSFGYGDSDEKRKIIEDQMPASMTKYLDDNYHIWVLVEKNQDLYGFNVFDGNYNCKTIYLAE